MDESLLEPEFAEPFKAWSTQPNPDNTDKLLKSIHPVLTAALRTYGTQKSPTLHTKAKIMALDALKRYDPAKSKLRTHLMFQLQGLRRAAAKETQIMSIPEQVALDMNHLRESENFLRDQLGRDPSDTELSDHTHLPVKRLAYIRGVRPSLSEGSYQRPTTDGEDIYQPAVQNGNNVKQWQEFIYWDLSAPDQFIMEHTVGLHGKPMLQNAEIAKRLRISPGAVSQRKARIQEKLNMQSEYNVF